jgi:hypothetical protein
MSLKPDASHLIPQILVNIFLADALVKDVEKEERNVTWKVLLAQYKDKYLY